MSGDSGAKAGGGSSEECEGEEQEDPSSSFGLAEESLIQMTISEPQGENKETLDDSVKDALSTFRQQWQKELGSPSKQNIKPIADDGVAAADSIAAPDASPTESIEEIAKKLFLSGVDHEQNGKLFEAIRFYKRAVALIPDIEFRLYESTQKKAGRDDTLQIETGNNNVAIPQDDDEFGNESLLERIQRVVARTGCLCQPEHEQKTAHISCLPTELVLYILRWVVSSELDMLSLERCAAVCRGFYLSARDQEIWRLACLKIWGVKCGTPNVLGFSSWRQMYVERVRLRFNGCYISKTTYLRLGENSFQDQFYKPWHIIDYYRYLRFFSDGVVLMLTTAEEPSSSIALLKQRHNRGPGVLSGEYRLHGDKVVISVRKVLLGTNKQPPSNTRFRPRRNPAQSPPETNVEQISNLELQIQSYRNRPSLVWCGYTVFTRNSNGGESSSSFDIVKSRFPPFRFSKVKSYQAESESPLQ